MIYILGAKNAISPILYVKTLFGVPDPPRMRISEALTSSSIRLYSPYLIYINNISNTKIE
jgi:hypothetical protein